MERDAKYDAALDALQDELRELLAKRVEMDARVEYLRESIIGLSHVCGRDAIDLSLIPQITQAGLTEACKAVLRAATHPMNPREVRDKLEELDYDLGKYVNAMASIHTTLKRLVESNVIEPVALPSGAPAYQLKEPDGDLPTIPPGGAYPSLTLSGDQKLELAANLGNQRTKRPLLSAKPEPRISQSARPSLAEDLKRISRDKK